MYKFCVDNDQIIRIGVMIEDLDVSFQERESLIDFKFLRVCIVRPRNVTVSRTLIYSYMYFVIIYKDEKWYL